MPVGTRKNIDVQLHRWVEYDQRFTRQRSRAERPQFLEAMLAGGQPIPVQNAYPEAGQQVRQGPAQLFHNLRHGPRGLPQQGSRDGGFNMVDLLIEVLASHRDTVLQVFVGRIDRRLHATDDQAHDIDDGREQQLARILAGGMLLEEGIDPLGIQGVLQQGAHHNTNGAFGHEAFDDFTQNRTR